MTSQWELWMCLSLGFKIVSLCACVCVFLKKDFQTWKMEKLLSKLHENETHGIEK